MHLATSSPLAATLSAGKRDGRRSSVIVLIVTAAWGCAPPVTKPHRAEPALTARAADTVSAPLRAVDSTILARFAKGPEVPRPFRTGFSPVDVSPHTQPALLVLNGQVIGRLPNGAIDHDAARWALKRLPVDQVKAVEILTYEAAVARFRGSGYEGAILISTLGAPRTQGAK